MEELKNAIEEQISKLKLTQLTQASQELSARYRSHQKHNHAFITSDEHRMAYLATRMPATFAAVSHVLHQVKKRIPQLNLKSFLDAGAGPGTGMWAAAEQFGAFQTITCIEKDRQLIEMGKKLAVKSPILSKAHWQVADLEKGITVLPHDLILMSYAIGELKESVWPELLRQLWDKTNQLFIVIEPGTPVGFQRIRLIRDQLIAMGGCVAAPCPHQQICPMSGNDWCHFSERVQRSHAHRVAKSADLGYEDEKFSYLVVTKEKFSVGLPRIIRHPQKRPGYVELQLCTQQGLANQIISKKHKEEYREAKKADWGSTIFIKP
jgi:ribosomal protein RSM22 (predicted rRNA methylase)